MLPGIAWEGANVDVVNESHRMDEIRMDASLSSREEAAVSSPQSQVHTWSSRLSDVISRLADAADSAQEPLENSESRSATKGGAQLLPSDMHFLISNSAASLPQERLVPLCKMLWLKSQYINIGWLLKEKD